MGHEPLVLDGNYEDDYRLIQRELNRTLGNVHDIRQDLHSERVRAEEKRTVQEENLGRRLGTYDVRLAVVEAKIVIYSVIASSLATLLVNWLMKKF